MDQLRINYSTIPGRAQFDNGFSYTCVKSYAKICQHAFTARFLLSLAWQLGDAVIAG